MSARGTQASQYLHVPFSVAFGWLGEAFKLFTLHLLFDFLRPLCCPMIIFIFILLFTSFCSKFVDRFSDIVLKWQNLWVHKRSNFTRQTHKAGSEGASPVRVPTVPSTAASGVPKESNQWLHSVIVESWHNLSKGLLGGKTMNCKKFNVAYRQSKNSVLCTCYWCQCHCRQKQGHKRHTAGTGMYPPSQPSLCFWRTGWQRAEARGTLFSAASKSCFFESVAWSGWNYEKSHIRS